MGTVVNIVIGTAFVFLIFSLVVSGVNEGLTAVFAIRSKILWQTLTGLAATSEAPEKLGLTRVLQLPFTAPWIERLPIIGRWAKGWTDPRPRVEENVPKDVVAAYVPNQDASDAGGAAPFIKGVLSRSERFDTSRKGRPTRVKHVSPQVISQVMIELGGELPSLAGEANRALQQGELFLQQILSSAAIKGTQLEAPVRAAIGRAQGDVDKFRAGIEDWFDARMGALSRVYKMWARWSMLGIGLVVAFVLNVNPVRTVDTLRKDTALAQATVDQATQFAKAVDPTGDVCRPAAGDQAPAAATPPDRIGECYRAVQDAVAVGRTLPPPLNFDHLFWGQDSWWQYILGSVLAGVAISLGAPFWFDTLRKIMSVRR